MLLALCGVVTIHSGPVLSLSPPCTVSMTSLVLGTGSGKSLSYQTVGSLLPGKIVLCVHPLLALSADQKAKIPSTPSRFGRVVGYHVDALSTYRQQQQLLRIIKNIGSASSNVSYFIFCSPQVLTNEKKPWLWTSQRSDQKKAGSL